MRNAQALVSALDRESLGTPRRAFPLRAILFALLFVIVFLACFGFGLLGLWVAWQTADWFNFWSTPTIFVAWLFVIPFVLVVRLRMPLGRAQVGARTLRQVANSVDDRIAPVATLQPAPLTGLDLPSGETRIGPLPRPYTYPANSAASAATILASLVFVVLFIPLILFPIGDDSSVIPGFLSWLSRFSGISDAAMSALPVLIFAVMLVVYLPLVTFTRMRGGGGGRGLYVTCDSQGIEWRQAGTAIRIKWDAVRSVSRITSQTSSDISQRTSYMIAAPDAFLIWTVSPFSGEHQFAASELLLRYAVTRTGQPLRDLSAIATELAQAGRHAPSILAWRVPAGTTSPIVPNVTEGIPAPRRARWSVVGFAILGIVVLLLFTSLYGGGAYLQHYQPQYFASLPARIHAEQPLYHDALSYPDGDWPQHTPTHDDYESYGYNGSAYQLTGSTSGNFIYALQRNQFGDAAYEVTATQMGKLTADGGDGVGIVFDASGGATDFLTFQVEYTGEWGIWHYKYVDDRASDNWSYVTGGPNTAIHSTPGGVNTLLVVARGRMFLCYVNDVFVGSYYANSRYDHLPSFGGAGVYLDDTALTGTFSNFTVYPVQPTSSFFIA